MQRFTAGGDPYVAVGVTIGGLDAVLLRGVPARQRAERTLRLIATSFIIGIIATTLFAAGLGYWMSGRLMRPLRHVADAAGEIASGGLDTRLAPEADPDLDRLASSFNDMADAVQARIEREAQVLLRRQPRAALADHRAVRRGRGARRPPRRPARPQPAGARRRRQPGAPVRPARARPARAVAPRRRRRRPAPRRDRLGDVLPAHRRPPRLSPTCPIDVDPGAERRDQRRQAAPRTDRRQPARERPRARRRRRRGSASSRAPGSTVLLAVEDGGPGVAASEKGRIFERFARGTASRHRVSGTGLGLALVVEHARSYGGDAWVEDRPGGGARFVVRFPNTRGRPMSAPHRSPCSGGRGAAIAVAACGVPGSSDFQRIDPDEVPAILSETTSTTRQHDLARRSPPPAPPSVPTSIPTTTHDEHDRADHEHHRRLRRSAVLRRRAPASSTADHPPARQSRTWPGARPRSIDGVPEGTEYDGLSTALPARHRLERQRRRRPGDRRAPTEFLTDTPAADQRRRSPRSCSRSPAGPASARSRFDVRRRTDRRVEGRRRPHQRRRATSSARTTHAAPRRIRG